MSETTVSQRLELCIERLRRGDAAARNELITAAQGRLTATARKIFRDYERLRGAGVETLDVFHNSLIRLMRALEQVKPESVREFYGLASLQIRRELVDLCRKLGGGRGAEPRPTVGPLTGTTLPGPDGPETDPWRLAAWTEFHEAVQRLDPAEREVTDLLWYQELSQEEAAEVLGVDKSTVKRRWRQVREKLASLVRGFADPDGD